MPHLIDLLKQELLTSASAIHSIEEGDANIFIQLFLTLKIMLKFDNAPAHVYENPPKLTVPLPIPHTFNPATGGYMRELPEGGQTPTLMVIQPLIYRLTYSSRHGKCKKEWLDVLFLNKFNRLGVLSLPNWYAIDLLQCLKILELRQIQIHGAWLSMTRRVNERRTSDGFPVHEGATRQTTANRGDKQTYIPHVNSYYWASTWDCVRASRTISDIRANPWGKDGK
jgi:hypothetical protein